MDDQVVGVLGKLSSCRLGAVPLAPGEAEPPRSPGTSFAVIRPRLVAGCDLEYLPCGSQEVSRVPSASATVVHALTLILVF